jgi:integrase
MEAAKSRLKPQGDTLGAFYLSAYLPTVIGRSMSWKQQIKWAWDKYLIELAPIPLADLNRAKLQQHFNKLIAKGDLNSSSVAKVKIVLSAILNLAVDDELIAKNPAARIRIPRGAPPNKKALGFQDLHRLIFSAEGALQNALILMAYSLNIGEACGAKRSHISNGCFNVRQQIVQDKGGAQTKDVLKHDNRYRDIPLPKEVEQLLLQNAPGIFLVQSVDGPPKLPNNVHRELDELIERIGIPRVTPHELRHTFISLMENELEAPYPVVCALSGKSNRRRTADYNHVSPKRLRAWSEKYWAELMSAGLTNEKFCQA